MNLVIAMMIRILVKWRIFLIPSVRILSGVFIGRIFSYANKILTGLILLNTQKAFIFTPYIMFINSSADSCSVYICALYTVY